MQQVVELCHPTMRAANHRLLDLFKGRVVDRFQRFVALSRQPGAARGRLTAWWSELRCGRLFGGMVRPDAYGASARRRLPDRVLARTRTRPRHRR
ncbi:MULTISPECIES: hypothetical protein [Pseudonocardiaceae]|uniref:Uncharacterized protein n=1 Tax=Amycolatopsis roodepoortensis TaxID=700274 RepID=A0ABR9LFJ9_9PSEU|nr:MULTISPECIES: hypothetical protein [Pseudonocardiaceae]MBE1579456.1 hypothetical protein [Amycolatopsis roodepoortensis]